ncbi:phenylalanine--tRNA ligase subunit beta [Patescibacteria group bacterium]|nr:phenylalanine--tRNA ligase subunit beta [Patescibacteria group bacterium]
MVFSYNWIQSFFKKKLLKPKEFAELLTTHSFEVSEVKRVGKDFVLDVDVLPNRGPDCFSHIGIARECAALTKSKIKYPKSKIIEDKGLKAKDFIKVEVKDQKACPRYTARVISGVKVAPSPKWLKEKLKVCGIRPINNIVDIANFVMLETGQPLHAFDGEKLEGPKVKPSASYGASKKIIVRFAKKRERIVTLDEEKYDLNDNILVIADAKKPVAIAGIKGGIIPEIDRETKIVVLESANFNPQVIRRGSKKLGLKTDASWRFEHGIDPNLTEFAINRAAFLVQKIAGGKIAQGLIDFYPKKVYPKKIKLNLAYVDRLLGVKISKKEIKNIFRRLNFPLYENSSRSILVEVPTFRLDLSLPEDLIEEIGRISGFQKIPAILPLVSLIPPKRNIDRFWENLSRDILKEAGFSEVYNYSFISQKMATIFEYRPKNLMEIENPMSLEQKYLRPSLIPNLLKNVKENMKNLPASRLRSGQWQAGFKEIKIFELGKIFRKDTPSKIFEKRSLTGLIFKKEKKAENFYELKGICDLLLEKMGISNFWYDTYKPTPEDSKISIWDPKKCAEIKVDHQEIGFLGEVSLKILEDLKIFSAKGKQIGNVVVFDFDFEKLQKLACEEHEFLPISKYPAAIRDLAVLVPLEVRVEEILNKIEITGGSLVRDVDLFDIYTGEEIPEGKKNLAFHIIYQSDIKTLSSREIDKIHQKIIKALEKEKEWEVRK